jgi:hypothetical protein
MWAVNNQTRFKADRTFARDKDGAEVWIVAVRATFSILPGGAIVIADEQQDVKLAPEYFGDPGKSSLRYDLDLVRTKPATDILVHAHAHAPGGVPAASVEVGWKVGPISKRLKVVGDRMWKAGITGLSKSSSVPFVTMPIRYERAQGGPLDLTNPVGAGSVKAPGALLPNCKHLSNASGPAGFGPIGYEWEPRSKLAGTYDEAWQMERQPLVPLDFQDLFYCCAPADQQVKGYLKGGEQVALLNLSPEGLLTFQLPKLSFGFNTRIDGGTVHHRSELYTVIIEPEERRLIMVWQTSLPCHHTLYTLKETVAFEKERIVHQPQNDTETEVAA